MRGLIRPILIETDSVSRKRPLLTRLFFDCILPGLLLIVSRVDVKVFVLSPEAVGVREYCCMAVESRFDAPCFVCFPRATCASRATNPRPSGLVSLDLAETRQSYVRGVALSREPPTYSKRSRCWQNYIGIALCCRCMMHAADRRRY